MRTPRLEAGCVKFNNVRCIGTHTWYCAMDIVRQEYCKTQFSPSRNSQFCWKWDKCTWGHGSYRRRRKISSHCIDTKGSEHSENVQVQGGDWKVDKEGGGQCLFLGVLASPGAWVPALTLSQSKATFYLDADYVPSPKKLVMGNRWAPNCQRERWAGGIRGEKQLTELGLRPRTAHKRTENTPRARAWARCSRGNRHWYLPRPSTR